MRTLSSAFVIIALILGYLGSTSARSVTVDVRAPWHRHPLSFIPEISEFVFDGTTDAFWNYVDGICAHSKKVDDVILQMRSGDVSVHSETLLDQISELQSVAFETASNITSKPMHTLMHTMVDFGHYSPAIQFFETLASKYADAGSTCEGGAFVVLFPGEKVVCSPSGLADSENILDRLIPSKTSLASSMQGEDVGDAAGSSEWDHSFPRESSQQSTSTTGAQHARKAVLYGLVGSSAFCKLHQGLANAVKAGQLAEYSARHHLQPLVSAQSAASLQGFGVFLDIKNMEYKNVDDASSASSGDSSTTVDPSIADWDTLGLNFEKVLQNVPASSFQERTKEELVPLLRDQLTQAQAGAGAEDSTMKVWKMHDLGLQTLQQVRTAATLSTSNAAMQKLQEIVHNFPRYASMISATKVSAAVREEVAQFYQTAGMGMGMMGMSQALPPNSVLINGRRTDLSVSTFNIFDLLVDIRSELAVTSKLAALNLPKLVKTQVARIATNVGAAAQGQGASQKQVRIDVSKGGKHVVSFLNNLEKDATYRHLPRSLRTLLQPAWSLTALSRNLYTLILVVDPLTQSGANILMQVYMMMQQQYPVRFGLVFNCVSTGPHAHEDFCRLFAQMRTKHSMEYATSFVLSLAQTVMEGDEPAAFDREFLSRIYTGTAEAMSEQAGGDSWMSTGSSAVAAAVKTAAVKEVAELFPTSATSAALLHADFVSNTTAYLTARNLPMNSYSLNGIVVRVGEDGQGLHMMMQLLGREQHHVTSLYRRKLITDKTKSLFSAILAQAKAYNRYHPMLDETEPLYVDLTPELLASVDFVIPALKDVDVAALDPVVSTTVLHLPLSRQGFAAAATALRWAITTAEKNSAATSGGDSDQDEDGEDGPPAVHVHQRVGFVWQVDASLSSDRTCDATQSESCATQDSAAQQESALKLLAQVRAALVTPGHVCGANCAAELVKAYQFLSEKFTDKASNEDLFKNLFDVLTPSASAAANAKIDVQDVVSKASLSHKAISTALFGADEASSAVQSATLVHNGRTLIVPMQNGDGSEESSASGLYEEDLVLLTSLEGERLANQLVPLVRSLAQRECSSGPCAHTHHLKDSPLDKHHHFSALLQQLSAYCGSYNAGGTGPAGTGGRKTSKGGSHRYDVSSTIDQLEGLQGQISGSAGSALLYRIEPPAASFASPVDDLQIVIVVDPLTTAGQRAAALIPLLSEQLQYALTVILMPRLDISDFPLQNFYRFVTAHSGAEEASVADAGAAHAVSTAAARFTSLPRQHTLTVRMDTPEPWNVQSSVAQQDIDNLRCTATQCGDPSSASPDSTAVTYALKNVLVAGQCFEGGAAGSRYGGMPPNGLQLTLTQAQQHATSRANSTSTASAAAGSYADTLVMQNLGYFQLQANPGLFVLDTAKGRATEIYQLQADQPGVDAASGVKYIAVRSFEDVIHRLLVHKRAGKEHLSLLGEDDATVPADSEASDHHGKKNSKDKGGLLSSLSKSLFGGSSNAAEEAETAVEATGARAGVTEEPEDDRIHVFSLATGHMYERLLRIMMLSVTRHSSKPVKFWLFENYLSPTFKQSAAVMAAQYGFEVGYVTYKWPQWLTQQTQQQRIIWGYKILFLDVLFPLNVKKVIYVDADQVVRADLKELWDLDLQGHAYAYTPFCTSREETLGFQFWQQGYWKDHLRGRPYHISALYVVDLQRFRRNAVGDSLRAIYDQLSRDPNSLANLDQDLPNYAQHQVPIFSLPQEWLWCESWCSDDSKSTAKTIDLCNNPLHKEPKLDMARRVVSGELFNQSWVQLDDEIRTTLLAQG